MTLQNSGMPTPIKCLCANRNIVQPFLKQNHAKVAKASSLRILRDVLIGRQDAYPTF